MLKILKNVDLKIITHLNEKNILSLSYEFLNLKIKKTTHQEFRSHEFKSNKRQISQLLTIQSKNTLIH